MNLNRMTDSPDEGGEDRLLIDLFVRETETQVARVIQRLLEMEQGPVTHEAVSQLLRDLHSIKGAARVVRLHPVVQLAHTMEDCLIRIREGRLRVTSELVDVLMRAADRILALGREAAAPAPALPVSVTTSEVDPLTHELCQKMAEAEMGVDSGKDAAPGALSTAMAGNETAFQEPGRRMPDRPTPAPWPRGSGPGTRWDMELLDRLMGLASQALSHGHALSFLMERLQILRQRRARVTEVFEGLRKSGQTGGPVGPAAELWSRIEQEWARCDEELRLWSETLGAYERKTGQWSHRLFLAVVEARVRPFADAVRRLPRLVRDTARALGKEARLSVLGNEIRVDREILERIEGPLMHLVRNAVDHGCESPDERRARGKPVPAVIRVEAELRAHELRIRVADDGRGVDLEALRQRALAAGWVDARQRAIVSEEELLKLLFRPGFTLKGDVTADSGRGIGLDIVRQTVQEMQGRVFVHSRPGQGTTFELRLPLTLSILRAVVVEVAGEPYAFPASEVVRILRSDPGHWETAGGRRVLRINGMPAAVCGLPEVLGLGEVCTTSGPVWTVVTGKGPTLRAWLVDRCLGDQDLTLVHSVPALRELPGLAGAAVLDDGRPVILLDPEKLADRPCPVPDGHAPAGLCIRHRPPRESVRRKLILVVENSVPERNRIGQVLTRLGYEVHEISEGWEAWQRLKRLNYDLVIAGATLSGMDGMELTLRMRRDARLRMIPVLILNPGSDVTVRQLSCESGANGCLDGENLQPGGLASAVARLLAS